MAAEVFLDASYAIALASPTDQNHARAVALARRTQAERLRFITTRAVVVEIGNTLSKLCYRAAAVKLLYALAIEANKQHTLFHASVNSVILPLPVISDHPYRSTTMGEYRNEIASARRCHSMSSHHAIAWRRP